MCYYNEKNKVYTRVQNWERKNWRGELLYSSAMLFQIVIWIFRIFFGILIILFLVRYLRVGHKNISPVIETFFQLKISFEISLQISSFLREKSTENRTIFWRGWNIVQRGWFLSRHWNQWEKTKWTLPKG